MYTVQYSQRMANRGRNPECGGRDNMQCPLSAQTSLKMKERKGKDV
jgi:hypothetical protein